METKLEEVDRARAQFDQLNFDWRKRMTALYFMTNVIKAGSLGPMIRKSNLEFFEKVIWF